MKRGFWLWAATLATYAFLYAPLAVVVLFSFNDSELNASWVGFTGRWYIKLLGDDVGTVLARLQLAERAGQLGEAALQDASLPKP